MHHEELFKETIFERSIADRVRLRRQRLDIIDKKKENINNELFNHYFDYLNPDIMIEKLKNASCEKKLKYGRINQ